MTWTVNPSVTINSVTYTSVSLDGISITYGRTDIWEQARSSYATINLLNTNDSVFAGQLNDEVIIQIDDSNGNPITIFTGIINTISNTVAALGSSGTVVIHSITAIGPFALMNRVITHTSSFPKEYDDDRIDRILTAAGVVIDVVDSPGVYEFTASTASPGDCYYWASYYANMAFGYIYETTDGTVGYANESRRSVDASTNGYLTIPTNTILYRSVASEINLNNLLNDLRLEWKNNQIKTATSASSITSYGKRAADILTELEDGPQAQNQADRYITLRSTPQTLLKSFTVQLDANTVSNALLDHLLGVYMGMPIEVIDFPNGIHNGEFQGFVEGWTMNLKRNQANLTLNVSEKNLSITPTRWQDVSAALIWSAVGAAIQWPSYD